MSAADAIRAALVRSRESEALAIIEAAAAGLDPDTAFQLGDAARRKRWHRSALPLLARAEEVSRNATAARSSLIECHSALRNWTEALAVASNLLARDPHHRRTLRQKAHLLARLGRGEEALDTLEIYAKLAQNWAEPFADMARLQAGRGDWGRAVAAAREAFARDPANEDALDPLIDGLVALGREAEIEAPFADLARRDPNRVMRTVRMYLRMGRPLAAVHACRGLVAARGDSTEVAATMLRLRGALAEAKTFPQKHARAALAALDRTEHKPGLANRIVAGFVS